MRKRESERREGTKRMGNNAVVVVVCVAEHVFYPSHVRGDTHRQEMPLVCVLNQPEKRERM